MVGNVGKERGGHRLDGGVLSLEQDGNSMFMYFGNWTLSHGDGSSSIKGLRGSWKL